MSGDGYKTWTRERLTVDDVQGFLQDQVVAAFDSASARSAAIAAPFAGLLTYRRDTDTYEGRTPSAAGAELGGAWRGLGRHWGSFAGGLPTPSGADRSGPQPGDTAYSSALRCCLIVSYLYEWRQLDLPRLGALSGRAGYASTVIAAGATFPPGFMVYVEDKDRTYMRDDGGAWRLLGGKAGAQLALTTGTGAPQTGWTGAGYTGLLQHAGNGMATVQFDIVRSGAAITPSTTGDVTNSPLLILPTGWDAAAPATIGPGLNGNRAAFAYMGSGGRTITLTNVTGTADIATGATLSFAGTYPLLTPGDLDD